MGPYGFNLVDDMDNEQGKGKVDFEEEGDKKNNGNLSPGDWDLADALSGGEQSPDRPDAIGEHEVEKRKEGPQLLGKGAGGVLEPEEEEWQGPFMSRGYQEMGPFFPPSGTAAKNRRLVLIILSFMILLLSISTAAVLRLAASGNFADGIEEAGRTSSQYLSTFSREMLQAAISSLQTPRVDASTQTGADDDGSAFGSDDGTLTSSSSSYDEWIEKEGTVMQKPRGRLDGVGGLD
ncbi:hypothetical protein ACSSS7_003279 [Eimeria intestinalis]